MSENLDLVRSIYADLARGDFDRGFRTVSEWMHPEFEWVVADGPTAGRFKGVAGMEESAYRMLDAWEELRFEGEEYRELDDERVLVLDHRIGRGKGSGVEVTTKGATVCHIREGRATQLVSYWNRGRALADLGLEA
jgi:ketosteroid isomerase-like protein